MGNNLMQGRRMRYIKSGLDNSKDEKGKSGKKQLQIDIPVMVSRQCGDNSCNDSLSQNFQKVPLTTISNSMLNSQTFASRQFIQNPQLLSQEKFGGTGQGFFSPQHEGIGIRTSAGFFSPSTVGPPMLFNQEAIKSNNDSNSIGNCDDSQRVVMASVEKLPSKKMLQAATTL